MRFKIRSSFFLLFNSDILTLNERSAAILTVSLSLVLLSSLLFLFPVELYVQDGKVIELVRRSETKVTCQLE